MKKMIRAAQLRMMLLTRQEMALLDLREEAIFALGHPLFAAQLSAGRIEIEILDRIPRKQTPIILYDDGEGLAIGAADRISGLGYTNVSILEGGLTGWRANDYEVFQDVNSYCKAFGELVETRRHTPSLPAPDVQTLIDEKADVVILDARRFDEYATMSVPTSTSVPGAELVLRADTVAPSPDTTIIVNCAGRTRSIIGTQSLINAGLPNRIFALRNGTIGWKLAGQKLDRRQDRRWPDVTKEALQTARRRAEQVSYRAGVRRLDFGQARLLAQAGDRTAYRFDVRTPEEYRAGHLPGFRSAPGGQLVQETDMFAPVRGARIILWDDLGPRAHMTASWLAQMGWEVYVVEGKADEPLVEGMWHPTLPPPPTVSAIGVDDLAARLDKNEVLLIDLAPSPEYRQRHIPAARFAIRAQLAAALALSRQSGAPIVLTSPDGALAEFATADLAGESNVRALTGGTAAWERSGRPLATGADPSLGEPIDVYKRPYEGTSSPEAEMQAYLDWEYGLVDQLERDATHGFFVV